nr:hypothetical protein CFP56_50808 [Quercus suber]
MSSMAKGSAIRMGHITIGRDRIDGSAVVRAAWKDEAGPEIGDHDLRCYDESWATTTSRDETTSTPCDIHTARQEDCKSRTCVDIMSTKLPAQSTTGPGRSKLVHDAQSYQLLRANGAALLRRNIYEKTTRTDF